jgi:ribosomal protein L12E/L44/L45/RPP1/RPP2
MAESDQSRVNLLGGSSNSVGNAARLKALRGQQIDSAVEGATSSASTPASAPTKSNVDFFKSDPQTPAQKKAKQEALLRKLRERGD